HRAGARGAVLTRGAGRRRAGAVPPTGRRAGITSMRSNCRPIETVGCARAAPGPPGGTRSGAGAADRKRPLGALFAQRSERLHSGASAWAAARAPGQRRERLHSGATARSQMEGTPMRRAAVRSTLLVLVGA